MEIERTFLLEAVPDGAGGDEEIAQGYVALDGDVEVRLRSRGSRRSLTVKGGAGRVRTEREIPLSGEAFATLWPLSEGRRVAKTRSLLPLEDGLVAEIDVFAGPLAGLRLVEVEFPDEAAAARFEPPAWFGAEVTEDPRYANRSLATAGAP